MVWIGVFLAVAGFVVTGCGPRRIVRDAATYTAEILAAVERQQEAMDALWIAADEARSAGDLDACRRYAAPALLIEAKARAQGDRALWLAGLPYRKADGTLPEPGEKQPDPGRADALRSLDDVCPPSLGEAEPVIPDVNPMEPVEGGGDNAQ